MKRFTALAALIVGLVGAGCAQTVDTPIGKITTELGTPDEASTARLYDEMDRRNAVTAYIWGIPAAGHASWRDAWDTVFGAEPGQFVAITTLEDRRGTMTPNNVASYVVGMANLAETGPLVYEDPAGNTAGLVSDLWWRAVCFVGIGGPFDGKGGRILILGPGQEDPGADGYHVVRSPTNHIWVGTRLLDFDVEKAIREVAPRMQMYPFGLRANPPRKPVVVGESRDWGQQPASGLAYFERLADILRHEPVAERDRFLMAMLAPLGIETGKPFAPDERQRRILTEAALLGELTMKAATAKRRGIPPYWEGRQWRNLFNIAPDQRSEHYDHFEERAVLYFEIFGVAIPATEPGSGSKYSVTYRDADGALLDGGQHYRLRVPADPPVASFWSVTAYDEESRSFIPGAERIGLGPQVPGYEINADGWVDVYFGPTPPEGKEANWVETKPGHGWFSYFRFFGPTEPFFDKSWILPDIERLPE